MYLRAKGLEIVLPASAETKVGIVTVKLETQAVLQTVEHAVQHVGVFGEKSRIHPYMIDQPPAERPVQTGI